MEVKTSKGEVAKGAVVSPEWLQIRAERIKFDPRTEATEKISFGWY